MRCRKKSVFVPAVSFLLFLILSTCMQPVSAAELAPDFKLKDLSNNEVALSGFRGTKPVLLLFWTTWCPYCRDQLKEISDRYQQLTGEGLQVLAVNVGETESHVKSFARSRNLSYSVLLDRSSDTARSYGILGIPTYILIDKKGEIVSRSNGFPEGQYKDLIKK